ncbi:MAG: DNA internalization-related competence protein ComEC/Rec2, partial [Rhizobacter sp.]|nr:DNA internalization-related competence protein ComEC/Rec2 [Rhizobacter sp.]
MAGADTGWRLAGLALAWLAGVALHLQERALQSAWVYALAVTGGGALLLAARRWPRHLAVALLGTALLAIGVSGGHALLRMAESLAPGLEGQDLRVTGVVASLPQLGASGLRFRFRIDQASLGERTIEVPSLVALGWYKGFHEDAVLSEPQAELRAGQRWRFTVRLRQPHGNINPHGFDYELYLFEQGVRATGYVRDAAALRLERDAGYAIERLRQRVRDAIDAAVPDRRSAGVLAALAVGDQGAIGREDWDLFRNTGIAHLVSISGLHVTMFAWIAGIGVAALWRRSVRAMLWLPLPQAARWSGLLAATAYALLAGWGVPAQRTVWMLATVTLLRTAGLRWPWVLVLLAAAVVVTAFDPWALLQAGFWLSFVAVGLLMASEPAVRGQRGAPSAQPAVWRAWAQSLRASAGSGLRTQVLVTLGLTPLTLVFFQQVSAVALAANLMSIPLVTLLITPLALLGTLWAPLWTLGAWLVQQLSVVLGWLAALPGAVWLVPVAPAWAQLAGLVAAVLLVLPLPWHAKALALPLLLPLLLPARTLPAPGEFELVAVDVGQGTAVLLRTRSHLLVYDAGPQYSRESNAGQRVLLPLLRARGEQRIDTLLLSHRDSDHVGGAAALLAGMRVDRLLGSLEPSHPVFQSATPSQRCEAGQHWLWDGVRFEVLSPQAGEFSRNLKPNALSCVLRVSTARRSALLTGDIERDQESALVSRHGAALRSDVLLVAHHGSRTSSTQVFLANVQPGVAIIQAG